MFLILEVKSANAATLGAASRAVFTSAGGSIGRRPGNDWVLPDPHVSGRHARVRAIGGTFFLEDNESANGVSVNGNRLHPGEPFPLKDGDTVFIDPFEMAVSVSMTKPDAVAAAPEAPAPAMYAPPVPPLASEYPQPGAGAGLLDEPPPAGGGLGDLIPEAGGILPSDFNPLLDEPAQAAPRAHSAASLQSKPVIHDAIRMPSPPVVPQPPARGGTAPAAAGGMVIPTNWDDLDAPAGPVPGAPGRPVLPPQPPAAPPLMAPPLPPPAAPVPSPAAAAPMDDGFASLMRAAGVPSGTVAPEVMAEFGMVLRVVIEGLMEVLRARGEIRSEFRLPQTSFKARDNNPLKMAVNAEDALHNLLVKRNPAYLGTTAAFEDAFKDVRHHQLAMLAGMRAAYGFMLQRFDPTALKQQFDARPGRKGFAFGAQGRHWEAFEEYFREITADSDDCFRRLFGDQFARAYEEQIQLLRSARDRGNNQT